MDNDAARAKVQARKPKAKAAPKKKYALPAFVPAPTPTERKHAAATQLAQKHKALTHTTTKAVIAPAHKKESTASKIVHLPATLIHTVYGTPSKGPNDHRPSGMGAAAVRGAAGGGPATTARATGAAFYTAPRQTTKNTLKGLRDVAAATPAGMVHLVTTRPDHTLKQIGEDYHRRYTGTFADQVKRIRKEGATAELLDLSGAAGGVGAVTGRAITKAVSAESRVGKVVKGTRPALRTSGGVAKPQELSPNAFKAAGQRVVDKARHKADTRRVEGTSKPADTARATPAFVMQALHNGEVTPLISGNANRAQRVAVAKVKSRAVHALKAEQNRKVENTARPIIDALNSKERKAFHYVATGQVPANEHAGAYVAQRAKKIREGRANQGVTEVRRRVDELRNLDKMAAAPHDYFTPRVAEAVRALHGLDREVAANDPALHPTQAALRRIAQQASSLGIERGVFYQATKKGLTRVEREESPEAFIKRVERRAKREGLESPIYFPSEPDSIFHNVDYSSRAAGGARAVAGPKRYTGKLYDRGQQDTHPEVYLTGMARSIKRKHNWNLVADQFANHALPRYANMPLGALRRKLQDDGIDPQSVSFWNPGIYRRALSEADITRGEGARHGIELPEEFTNEDVTAALAQAAHENDGVIPAHLAGTKGWTAVPRAAFNEIMDATRPANKGGRMVDILRGKQSRLLLGLNPAWNTYQVLSNVGLGMPATGGRLPLRLAQQAKLYRDLSPEGRDAMDVLVGEGSSLHNHQTRLGATGGRISKRAARLKATKADPILNKRVAGVGPRVRDLNPLEWGFAADRKQNVQFRRALLVDSLKKHGEELTPDNVERILHDPVAAEQHAQFVNDWLGDYTTLTANERKGIARYGMFYGFLRHSLTLMFKTLPTKHPLMLMAALKLGQLQKEELRKLGVDELPWAAGKLYFTHGDKLQELDLSRANPAMNALTGTRVINQAIGLAPPLAGALANQIASRDLYRDRGWAVDGTYAAYGAKASDYGLTDRAQIGAQDVLSTVAPYRVAQNMTEFGPQGDDSILGSEPTRHTSKKAKAADRKWAAQDHQDANLLRQLAPFVPHPSRDVETAADMAKRKKPKKKKAKQTNYHLGSDLGGGSMGGGDMGGGSLGG